jgi:hypothetical protein
MGHVNAPPRRFGPIVSPPPPKWLSNLLPEGLGTEQLAAYPGYVRNRVGNLVRQLPQLRPAAGNPPPRPISNEQERSHLLRQAEEAIQAIVHYDKSQGDAGRAGGGGQGGEHGQVGGGAGPGPV